MHSQVNATGTYIYTFIARSQVILKQGQAVTEARQIDEWKIVGE